MCGRVLIANGAVARARNHDAVADNDGADRHLTRLGGETGLLEGEAHEAAVGFGVKRHLGKLAVFRFTVCRFSAGRSGHHGVPR